MLLISKGLNGLVRLFLNSLSIRLFRLAGGGGGGGQGEERKGKEKKSLTRKH